MFAKFKSWFAAPVFVDDEERTRLAGLLNMILTTSTLVAIVLIVGGLIGGNLRPSAIVVIGIFGIITLGLRWMMRRGAVKIASLLLILLLSLFTASVLAIGGTIRGPGLIYLVLANVMAGLLISRQAALVSAVANCLIVFGLIVAENSGWLPPPINSVTITQGIAFAAGALLTVVLVNQATGNIGEALTRAHRELADRQHTETQLQQRAEEMFLLYQMGIALTSGQNLYHALRALVKELRRLMIVDAFHVVMYDEQTDMISYPLFLNLGEDLRLPPRKLSANPGLTGEVISTRKTLYLPDISQPEVQQAHQIVVIVDVGIHSYIGIPLITDGRIIGVLSVQARAANAYSSEQVRMLETLAAQVAITVEKSRLLEQLQQELAERKRAEAEIRQLNLELEERVERRTAELAAANKELEAFSYSISHDLRAPLRGIDGFSRLLLERYAAQLDETGQHHLRRVRENAQRMGDLIDDLLEFSRLSRQPLRKQPVDPASAAREALAELQLTFQSRRLNVAIADLPSCHADPSLLRQVFANLLGNAVKYTVGREVAEVEVGFHQEGDATIYFVRDNGVGFDMRYADKLFGVFQRLHSENEFEGAGVGLAIVKRIIERHSGRVWAEAEVDKGATFFFTLPE
jgi:signal transduction histidine kinase